jgi:glycosyltransferase involved in cell wall biosynthesis
MRIVHVITSLDSLGGAQRHVIELVNYLQQRGVTSEIWGYVDRPDRQFEDCAARIVRIPGLTREVSIADDLRAAREIHRRLLADRPPLVVLNSSKAGALGRLACVGTGVPVCFTVHGWSFTEGKPIVQRGLYWMLEFVLGILGCLVICVSKYDWNLGVRARVVTAARCHLVYNGAVDIGPEWRASPGSSRDMVMVARHSAPKDHAMLLQAVAGIREPGRVLLVGGGPDLEKTRAMIKSLGLESAVRLVGEAEAADVRAIIAGAGIMVLASNWEGLPRSVIEGMRAGLPIVATRVGGLPELVEEGVNGLLVPRGDVGAIKSALEYLLHSPAERIRMGAKSRAFYEKRFSEEKCFGRMWEVLQGIAGKARPGAVI